MKKVILMFCMMALSTLSLAAQETEGSQDLETTILAGCPCKNKDKKPS